MSRFAAFGSTLRAQAQELQAKAAEGVTKIQEQASKTVEAVKSPIPSAASASPAPSLTSLKSGDVSKEELLEILQKLNKKVKALSIIRQQLTERCETAEKDKERLKSLVVEEILNGAVDLQAENDEVLQLQQAWRKFDEEKALTLQQLHQEFQVFSLQQQHKLANSSNGESSPNEDWQAEKQALEEKHALELAELKAKLEQLQIEGGGEDAMAKIKAAAQAQLQAFKQKVAAARQEELAKVKRELVEQAATELEAKLAEQAETYEAKLVAANAMSGLATSDAPSQQLDEFRQQHTVQLQTLQEEHASKIADVIEKTRQQVEQSVTTEMEEKLQECIGDMRRNHELELEKLQQQASEKLAEAIKSANDLVEEAKSAQAQVLTLRAELETSKAEHETTLNSLQNQIDLLSSQNQEATTAMEAQLEEKNEELATAAEKESSLLVELEKTRSSLTSAQNEKEAIILSAQNNQDATKTYEDAMSKQRASFEEQLERVKTEHGNELSVLQKSLEEANTSHSTVLSELSSLQTQLTETTDKLQMLTRDRDVEGSTFQQQLEDLKMDLAARQKELLESQTGASEMEARVEQATSELESLKKRLIDSTEKSNEELASLQLGHAASLARLNQRLQDKTRELEATSCSESEQNAAYSELQQTYQDLQAKFSLLESESSKSTATLQSELDKIRVLNTALEQRVSMANEASEQGSTELSNQIQELQSRLSDLSRQKDAEMEQLKSDFELKLLESSQVKAKVEEESSQLKRNFEAKEKELTDSFEERLASLKKEREDALEAKATETAAAAQTHAERQSEMAAALQEREIKIEELTNELKQLVARLEDKENSTKAAQETYAETIVKMREEIESAKQQLADASTQATDEEIEERLRDMAAKKDKEMRQLVSEHQRILQELRDELESGRTGVENDLAGRMEKQKSEFDEQISNMERKHTGEKEELRKSMEEHVDAMKLLFKEKLDSIRNEGQTELQKVQNEIVEQVARNAKLEDEVQKLTAATAALRSENEDLKATLESESSKTKALHHELASLHKEKDETVRNSSDTATELLQQQEKLEKENAALLEQNGKLKVSVNSKSNKVEELMGKLEALTVNLNSMAEQSKIQEEKLQLAATNEARLKASESEVDSLRDQINKLKLEMTQNATLVSRLQSEKDANERRQGERSALVGMLESKLAELNEKNSELNAKLEASMYDLSQRDEALQSSEERISKLEKDVEEAAASTRRTSEALALAQKGAEANSSKRVEALQKELQSVKQQMARKSAAAQKMLQEREAECAELRKTTKALQHEVDKGSLSDRKIFELAEKQSNRESMLASEIEARNNTIEHLRKALVSKDDELAVVEAEREKAEKDVEELCRVKRREDVNVDYLKSIIVQYLSLPPGSTERAGLLPVIATLLQFDPRDYRRIEEGKNKISWWGNIAPTLIAAPSDISQMTASTGGAAEVSVSVPAVQEGKRPTSLQF